MTTREYTHDEAWTALGAAALGALDADEQRAVLAHVASCPVCAPELASLSDASASLAFLAPPVEEDAQRDARLRRRLVARAAADREERGTPGAAPLATPSVIVPPAPPALPVQSASGEREATVTPIRPVRIPRTRTAWWLAAAATVAFAASTAALVQATRERNALRAELASAEAMRGETAALRDSLADRERLVRSLTGREVTIVEMSAQGAREARARMFWDQATEAWTLLAHDLPAPGAGQTYQLWLVTRDGSKISAGTFAPDPRGRAMVRAQYALERADLQLIAVTLEPEGGVPQPTGPIVIAGAPGAASE